MRNCRETKKSKLKSIISNIKTHSDFFSTVPQLRPLHTKYILSKGHFGIHIFTQFTNINKQTRDTSETWMVDTRQPITMIVPQSCVAAGVKTSNPSFWFFIQVLFLCCLLSHVQCVKTFSWQLDSSLLSDFIYGNHRPRRIPGGFGTHLAQEKINYHLQADPAL